MIHAAAARPRPPSLHLSRRRRAPAEMQERLAVVQTSSTANVTRKAEKSLNLQFNRAKTWEEVTDGRDPMKLSEWFSSDGRWRINFVCPFELFKCEFENKLLDWQVFAAIYLNLSSKNQNSIIHDLNFGSENLITKISVKI